MASTNVGSVVMGYVINWTDPQRREGTMVVRSAIGDQVYVEEFRIGTIERRAVMATESDKALIALHRAAEQYQLLGHAEGVEEARGDVG